MQAGARLALLTARLLRQGSPQRKASMCWSVPTVLCCAFCFPASCLASDPKAHHATHANMPPKRAATGKGKRRAESDSEDEDVSSDFEAEELPKKKAKAAKRQRGGGSKGASTSRVVVSEESLAARLPRSALEGLFCRLLKGEEVTRTEVEALLRTQVRHGVDACGMSACCSAFSEAGNCH